MRSHAIPVDYEIKREADLKVNPEITREQGCGALGPGDCRDEERRAEPMKGRPRGSKESERQPLCSERALRARSRTAAHPS